MKLLYKNLHDDIFKIKNIAVNECCYGCSQERLSVFITYREVLSSTRNFLYKKYLFI